MYQRDEKGKVVKTDDHLMDAMRYFVLSGRDRMSVESHSDDVPEQELEWPYTRNYKPGHGDWMGH